MNRQPAQDIRPLLAVVGGLVAFTVTRSDALPAWGSAYIGLLLEYAAGPVLVLGLAALTARVVVTRRSLGRRTRLVVLAPDSFAPTLEAVVRCAAQLSRVRRV